MSKYSTPLRAPHFNFAKKLPALNHFRQLTCRSEGLAAAMPNSYPAAKVQIAFQGKEGFTIYVA